MGQWTNKVMSAREAVSRYIKDGDELIIGNYTICTCSELVCEVIRQQKKKLTLYSQSGILDVEMLVGAGLIERLVTTYVMRSGGKAGGSAVERAIQNRSLELEDYTNFNYNARLLAGMHGFSFMQVFEGIMATDLFEKRGFMGENKYKVIECPFTGKPIPVVPAVNPDVCIVHVQRADCYGNAQYWGAMGSVAAAALCAKKIIVSCEEIVDHDIIRSSPHHTIIPAFRTSAVVEIPWGAHPTEVVGYYNQDRTAYGLFQQTAVSEASLQAWLDEWVYQRKDRKDYLEHYIELMGVTRLDKLKAKPYYSAPVSYGSAFNSTWDENGRDRLMGVTRDELETIIKNKGLFHG
jgi:glutaconate CoA-transferase subunit A